MLAWYVNGRLSEEERGEVERRLGASASVARAALESVASTPEPAADLRREVAEFRALRAAVAEVGAEEPSFPPNLVQDAWRRIQAHEKEQAVRAEARPAARLGRFFDAHIASLWRNATGVGRLALAGQLGLVLLLGMALLRAPESAYVTSSGPQTPSAAPRARSEPGPLRVKVMFSESASQQAVGALLRRLDAQIVAGPSNQGLYTVAAQGPADLDARALSLDALVGALEAEPALVRGVVREGP